MKKIFLTLLPVFIVLFPGIVWGQVIITVAGDSTAGYNGDNIAANTAHLKYPQSVATDSGGNVYIGDVGNGRIRKVSQSGIITTYAGTGGDGDGGDGGPATAASLNAPYMATDHSGNLYFSDPLYNRIRKINAAGVVSNFAGTGTGGFSGDGGPAAAAQFSQPTGIAVDGNGNVYISDNGNNRVRKINTAGFINTIAGGGSSGMGDGGPATAAQIFEPDNITVDNAGNVFVVSGNLVRKIDVGGIIATFAGVPPPGGGTNADGHPATSSVLSSPAGIAADGDGNVYISDAAANRIRKVNTSGIITSIAGNSRMAGYSGNDIPATTAKLNTPTGLAIDAAGNVYVADYYNNRVRAIVSALSANDVQSNVTDDISVSPNPCHDRLQLHFSPGNYGTAVISVINVMGEKVKEFSSFTDQPVNLEVGAVPGVYFLKVSTTEGQWCKQFMVR